MGGRFPFNNEHMVLPRLRFGTPPQVFLGNLVGSVVRVRYSIIIHGTRFMTNANVSVIVQTLFSGRVMRSFTIRTIRFGIFPMSVFQVEITNVLFRPQDNKAVISEVPFTKS